MKTLLTILALVIFSITLNAQTWQWSQKIQGSGSLEEVIVKGVDIDLYNNTYVTGYFNGSVTAPNGTITSNTRDAFIAKFGDNGALHWFIKGGGGGDDAGNAISVETYGEGALYITGYVSYNDNLWNVVFQGNSGSLTLPAASGGTPSVPLMNYGIGAKQIYVAKYTLSGDPVWITPVYSYLGDVSAINNGAVEGQGLSLVASYRHTNGQSFERNVYVSGFFSGGYASFPKSSGSIIINGVLNYADPHGFVAKFSGSNGKAVWAKSMSDGTPNSISFATSISMDLAPTNINGSGSARGNLYVTGDYSISADVCGVSFSTGSGYDHGFIARLSPATGTAAWAQELNATNGNISARDIVAYPGMNQYIYTTGDFTGTSITLNGTNTAGYGDRDVYIYKIDRNTAAISASKVEGALHDQYSNAITIDNNGDVYTAGTFNQTINLSGNTMNTVNPGVFENDHYMAKYDNNLNFACGTNWEADFLQGTSWGNTVIDAVDVCASKIENTAYYAGMFFSNETPDFNSSLSAVSDASYVAKWLCCDCPPPTITSIVRPGMGSSATIYFSYPPCSNSLSMAFQLTHAAYTTGVTTQPVLRGTPSITVTGLTPSVLYEWLTQNFCGNASPLSHARSTQSNALSSDDNLQVKVYPNPANDAITVSSNASGQLEIYNILGQRVKAMNVNSGIDLSISTLDLSNGSYVLKFITIEKETITEKIVVSHHQ